MPLAPTRRMAMCHPERNGVESKFCEVQRSKRANRKAKPLRDLRKSVTVLCRKVTFAKEFGIYTPRPRLLCAVEILRLASVRSLRMTIKR